MARTKGSKGITRAEEQTIRLGLQLGKTVKQIAEFMDRPEGTVYRRIQRMKATGEIDQLEMPMGQYDG